MTILMIGTEMQTMDFYLLPSNENTMKLHLKVIDKALQRIDQEYSKKLCHKIKSLIE
jgi:hypothetical protein